MRNNKNRKVYILTSGDYSNYRIEAVCSKKYLAKRLERVNLPNWQIEEYVVDGNINNFKKARSLAKKGYRNYFIKMDREGEVQEILSGEDNHWNSIVDILDNGHISFSFDNRGFDSGRNFLYGHILAKNDKQAIKIVNDKRASFIANNEWGKV